MAGNQAQKTNNKVTLTERVRHQLEDENKSGFYEPDEHLDETALAIRLGCSRTPVREALSQLVAVGLLVRRSHCGVYVAWPDQRNLRQIVEAYIEIEALGTYLAISRMSEADRQAIAHKARDGGAVLEEIRAVFGNPVIDVLADSLKARLDPFFHWKTKPQSNREELVAALCCGDGHSAVEMIRGQMRSMIDAI